MNQKNLDMQTSFRIHAYGLQELALFYFPHSTPQGASNQLKRWMRKEPLRTLLQEACYEPGQKILTPRQVAVIVRHVGEP